MFKCAIRTASTVVFLFLFSVPTILANENVKGYMLENLDLIQSMFKVRYAPYELKKKLFNWDLDAEISKAKAAVEAMEQPDFKLYHKIVKDFFTSTRDYHVQFGFYSTEEASLPFTVKSAEGKCYLAFIDRQRLPRKIFPFSIGDELVNFGDISACQAISNLKMELAQSNYPTDTALAELYLTQRSRTIALDIPQGSIKLVIKPNGLNKLIVYKMKWDYSPELINYDVVKSYARSSVASTLGGLGIPSEGTWFNRSMLSPLWNTFSRYKIQENPYNLGTRTSYIPSLGTKIWQSPDTCPFHAYIYRKNSRTIGYIRIPIYLGGIAEITAFAEIMQKFQQTTDALVIDQINNPGGSLFYIYALISMLTDKKVIPPTQQESISQEDQFYAIQNLKMFTPITNDQEAKLILGDNLDGYPVTYELAMSLKNYFQFIYDQWNQGNALTDQFPIFGIDTVNQHPSIRYTKPILLVNNALDFSGGDFFPAILQDNKRVTIFGTKTSGAGGYVINLGYPNYVGQMYISFTGSIAQRTNGTPIENSGVTPDIVYNLTTKDLTNNFSDYAKAINKAVLGLIK